MNRNNKKDANYLDKETISKFTNIREINNNKSNIKKITFTY